MVEGSGFRVGGLECESYGSGFSGWGWGSCEKRLHHALLFPFSVAPLKSWSKVPFPGGVYACFRVESLPGYLADKKSTPLP
jgi:hypothetical protein